MNEQFVKIFVNPKVFPLHTVFSASYALLEQLSIRIEGDLQKEIIVKLKPKDSTESAEHVKELFNEKLMDCALDEYRSMAASDIRNYFVRTALSFDADDEVDLWSSQSSEKEGYLENISYHISPYEEGVMELSIDAKQKKNNLLERIFSIAKRLRADCSFEVKEVGNDMVICKLKLKNGCDLEALNEKLEHELQSRMAL
ncbi:TPA: hypothetical protein EYP66_07650 [Candidatus Poribacteria bacterium]|nr:hypothetical protein [Candidatus Poribacteria bacterium]